MASDSVQPTEVDFQKEVRLAVVMYGGISLAIYMNGIAQELLSLVRSTAPNKDDHSKFRYKDSDLSGTSAVYRDLARFLTSLEPGVTSSSAPNRFRFIVDILSGTSAGGLNGMFLAKALANESTDLSALETLWIKEGDISKLLNDKRSLKESAENLGRERSWRQPPGTHKPASLLNSERMYVRLFQALGDMNPPEGKATESLVDQLDLFMTATDIEGLTTPIYLSDRKVEEQKHKTVFHFRYLKQNYSLADGVNDFIWENDGFLAFVGRATSSIVPAFEPMRLADIARSTGQNPDVLAKRWDEFYRPYWRTGVRTDSTVNGTSFNGATTESQERAKLDFLKRDFGDGGYLDNRPFTYATKTLSERVADLPVIRKLFYVEPDPIDVKTKSGDQPPNFVEHALAAFSLPSIDSIRDDIEVVRQRNEVIDRLSRIIDHVERVFVKDSDNWKVDLKATSARRNPNPTPSQLSYLHIRVSAVTDAISAIMANQLGFEEDSPYRPMVRQLVRVWRDATYQQGNANSPTEEPDLRPKRFEEFLDAFDFGFYERCINFLHRRINKRLNQGDPSDDSANFSDSVEAVPTEATEVVRRLPPTEAGRTRLLQLKRCLNEALYELRAIRGGFTTHRAFKQIGEHNVLGISLEELGSILRHPHDLDKLKAATEVLTKGAYLAEDGSGSRNPLPTRLQVLQNLTNDWQRELITALRAFRIGLLNKIDKVGCAIDGKEEVDLVRSWFEGYELVDEVMLPMTYATGALESNSVDIHRISPLDALSLIRKRGSQEDPANAVAREKLVGNALGHFGAFFDVGGRARDILWGRLDAAERLIKCLSPTGQDAKRDEFRNRAHLIILANPPSIPSDYDAETRKKAQFALDLTVLKLMLLIIGNLRPGKTAEWGPNSILEDIKAECAQTLENLESIPNRERKAILSKLMSLLEDQPLAREALRSSSMPPLEVENADKVDLTGRSLNILGKMFDGIYPSKKWGALSLGGSIITAVGKVLVPNSVEDILWKHWFGLLVILSGAWILIGTLFNSPEVSRSGITLLLFVLAFGYVLRKVKLLPSSKSVAAFLGRLFGVTLIVGLLAIFAFTLYVLLKYKQEVVPGLGTAGPWLYVGIGAATVISGIGLLFANRKAMRKK